MGVSTQKGCRREAVRLVEPYLREGNKKTNDPREMQLFLISFIIVEICEIFTVGGFPLNDAVRKVSGVGFCLMLYGVMCC